MAGAVLVSSSMTLAPTLGLPLAAQLMRAADVAWQTKRRLPGLGMAWGLA